MRGGLFGWDLPPGVTSSMIPGNGPVEICTQCGQPVDDCICPECPVCQSYGDPLCYQKHGLKLTDEQIDGMVEYQERLYWALTAERIMEDQMYEAWKQDQEERQEE